MTQRPRRATYIELEAAARMANLPPARVRRYVRIGLVRPAQVEGQEALFDDGEIARLRRIRRLGEDLGLNIAGIEVVLRLIDQIEALQRERDAGRPATTVEAPR
jgi:MerR family transcriptional regulator/heat shock protein HspR